MANNFSDRTNKDLAGIAKEIMEKTPAQVSETKSREPIQSNIVDRVLSAGMTGRFKKLDEARFGSREDDWGTGEEHPSNQPGYVSRPLSSNKGPGRLVNITYFNVPNDPESHSFARAQGATPHKTKPGVWQKAETTNSGATHRYNINNLTDRFGRGKVWSPKTNEEASSVTKSRDLFNDADKQAYNHHVNKFSEIFNNAKPGERLRTINRARDSALQGTTDQSIRTAIRLAHLHAAVHKGNVPDSVKLKEDVEQIHEKDNREYDYEGEMAISQLKSIITNAKKLHDMLDSSTNLPEWVQSKITLAEDYIVTATNYMEGEMNEEVEKSEPIDHEALNAKYGKPKPAPEKHTYNMSKSHVVGKDGMVYHFQDPRLKHKDYGGRVSNGSEPKELNEVNENRILEKVLNISRNRLNGKGN